MRLAELLDKVRTTHFDTDDARVEVSSDDFDDLVKQMSETAFIINESKFDFPNSDINTIVTPLWVRDGNVGKLTIVRNETQKSIISE